MYYTLGQRKGLGIGGVKGEKQDRWYVIDKDLSSNKLIVSCGEGEELFSNACECSGLNIIGKWDKTEFEATAKFRYRQGEQKVLVRIDGDKARFEFDQPQRAVTPGQYAVIYTPFDDERRRCLGGAVIDTVIKY
jgi:tRNA-specific 2-thiouridylase